MAWMGESFRKDKRFLKLQLKRGHIKRQDVEKILETLPDVSEKAEMVQVESPSAKEGETTKTSEEVTDQED